MDMTNSGWLSCESCRGLKLHTWISPNNYARIISLFVSNQHQHNFSWNTISRCHQVMPDIFRSLLNQKAQKPRLLSHHFLFLDSPPSRILKVITWLWQRNFKNFSLLFFINILLGQHNQNTFSSLDGRGDFEACDWIFLATDYYCRMFAMFWQDFISRNFPSVTISAWPLMVLVGKSWKSFERVRSAVGKLSSSSIWKCATFSLPHHTPHSALCFDSPCQNLDGCQHGHYTHTSRAERGKRLIAFEHAKRKQGRESMSFHGVFGAPFCGSREHKIIFIKISLGVKLHIARVGRSES